jgi:molybdopterin converting factor small subunit/proteasome lid subunit RPN8/RPN11
VAVTVYIPTPFRRATGNRDRVDVAASRVGELLDVLEGTFAELRGLVRDERGEVHAHINIYVNQEPIEDLQGLDTPLREGDEVAIIPALAGGAGDGVAVLLTPEERAAIERQAVEEYPAEACGVVMVRGTERRLLRCRNIQDELHARDPQRYPRDARTAYHMATEDRLAMIRLEAEGFTPAVIYHSHVDAGAYFSETDRRQALLGGEPIYPDATWVVVSVVERRVAALAAFRWDPARREFVPVALTPDPAGGAGGAARAGGEP